MSRGTVGRPRRIGLAKVGGDHGTEWLSRDVHLEDVCRDLGAEKIACDAECWLWRFADGSAIRCRKDTWDALTPDRTAQVLQA